MMEYDDIKTEGKGFLRVHDANKRWILASKEQRCTTGFCPFCLCEMYLTHKGELYYYAKKPGKTHSNSICLQIEKNGKYYSVDKTSFADLIKSLCHVSVSKGSNGGGGGKKSTDEDEPASTEISNETGFTSLRQIYDYRLDQLKYQTEDEIKEIKNYILYHEWARQILVNNKSDLFNKIVYAKFIYADENQYMLHFLMYADGWNCRFVLRFKKFSDFKLYFNKLMKKVQNDNGSIGWQKRYEYQTALIAAEAWEKLNEVQSKRMCGADKYYDKCLGVYMTEFHAKGQVHLPKALL